jgi:hypothetical protein
MQITELHYRHKPTCDNASVKARAQELLESELDFSELDSGEVGKSFLLVHKQYPVEYSDAHVPAQTAILAADSPPSTRSIPPRNPAILALPRC